MNLPLFIRLMRGQFKTILCFVLLFALGMSLFLTVDTMSLEFVDSLRSQSKQFLGGDIEIRHRKALSTAEQEVIDQEFRGWQHSEEWRFFTMLSGPERTLLVQARAVEDNFPLVGSFSDSASTQEYPAPPAGVVYVPQSLLKILGLQVGDSLQVGLKQLSIAKVLEQAPDSRFAFAQFTQRFYMNLADLEDAGLMSKGARIFRHQHFLKEGAQLSEGDLLEFKQGLLTQLKDPELVIESAADSNTELSSRFNMAIRLAKLLSLFTFMMAALGALQFFFNHLDREKSNRVLFQTLGMHQSSILRIYFFQGFVLTTLSLIVGWFMAKVWTAYLADLLTQKFGIDIQAEIRPEAFLLLSLASFISYFLLILGPMIQLRVESAKSILSRNTLSWKLTLLVFVIQLGFGYLLAWVVTTSWILSVIFLVLLIAGFLGMSLFGLGMDQLLRVFKKFGFQWKSWESLRLLLLYRPGKSLLVFSLLGLVTLVLYLMPGLNSMLKQQLLPEDSQQLPRWFMIDIQEEHLEDLNVFLEAQGYQDAKPAPMIRARLLKINGEHFVRKGKAETLEEEQEKRMRNRGYNLSYRLELDPSETLREGQFWSAPWSGEGIPEISVEYRFMQRLGFSLGDTLEFEIEGFPQEGVITSVREIRWSSFKPNFFVQFQPGAIDLAPKTFILSLPLIEGDDLQFQEEFFKSFPTISLVDLKEVVRITVEQLEKISVMLSGITFFALLCGLVLLLEIAFELAQSAKKEMHLRFSLGQDRRSILWIWLSPLVFWLLLAWALGYGLHVVFVTLIGRQLFGDLPWTPELSSFLWSLPFLVGFILAVGVFFYRALVKEATLEILKARD